MNIRVFFHLPHKKHNMKNIKNVWKYKKKKNTQQNTEKKLNKFNLWTFLIKMLFLSLQVCDGVFVVFYAEPESHFGSQPSWLKEKSNVKYVKFIKNILFNMSAHIGIC